MSNAPTPLSLDQELPKRQLNILTSVKFLYVVIGLALVSVVGAGGVVVGRYLVEEKESSSTSLNVSWLTYTNHNYGFSFDYPSSLRPEYGYPVPYDNASVFTLVTADFGLGKEGPLTGTVQKGVVFLLKIGPLPRKDFVQMRCEEVLRGISKVRCQQLSFKGLPAALVSTGNQNDRTMFIERSGKLYSFEVDFSPVVKDKKYLELFEQMLSTFKFTEVKADLTYGWSTFMFYDSNGFGYELKMPETWYNNPWVGGETNPYPKELAQSFKGINCGVGKDDRIVVLHFLSNNPKSDVEKKIANLRGNGFISSKIKTKSGLDVEKLVGRSEEYKDFDAYIISTRGYYDISGRGECSADFTNFFDLMLSTFKFTDKRGIGGVWRVYVNSEYHFEFAYPVRGIIAENDGLYEGECGKAIFSEKPTKDWQGNEISFIQLDNFFLIKVINWQKTIEEYIKELSADGLYVIEDLPPDHNTDEAVVVTGLKKALSEGSYNPLENVDQIYRKNNKLFLLLNLQNPTTRGGCVSPRTLDPIKYSQYKKVDWDVKESILKFVGE